MVVCEKLALTSRDLAIIDPNNKKLSDLVADAHLVGHGIDIVLDENSLLVSACWID